MSIASFVLRCLNQASPVYSAVTHIVQIPIQLCALKSNSCFYFSRLLKFRLIVL